VAVGEAHGGLVGHLDRGVGEAERGADAITRELLVARSGAAG
jgi:hypothetical protein